MSSVAAPSRPILVAVSARERDLFRIDDAFAPLTASGASVVIHLCDSPAARTTDWTHLLATLRPEVLVVGWAAPAFPPGYLDAPDCPVRHLCYLTGSVRRHATRAFLERGGRVTNWGDLAAPAVAEHALLLLLSALRRAPEWRDFAIGDSPLLGGPVPLATRTLHGATVAIHGFGLIARQLVRLLEPFGVTVRVHSEGVSAEYIHSHGAEPVATLDALFAGAAILVEVEALNDRSRGSVGAAQIESLAPDAVFVNVGRGAVVDEAALARRAARGDLTLALDVLAVEPLPHDSPLRELPNLILSPHVAGPARDQLPLFARHAAEQVRSHLSGEPALNPITPEIFDRST